MWTYILQQSSRENMISYRSRVTPQHVVCMTKAMALCKYNLTYCISLQNIKNVSLETIKICGNIIMRIFLMIIILNIIIIFMTLSIHVNTRGYIALSPNQKIRCE